MLHHYLHWEQAQEAWAHSDYFLGTLKKRALTTPKNIG